MNPIRTVLLSLLSLASVAAYSETALQNYACLHMNLTVKNHSAHSCYLLTEELTEFSAIPGVSFKILPNEQTVLDLMPSSFVAPIAMELVYECGEGSYIRLYSYKNECGHQNSTEAKILYAAQLTATAEQTHASYWSNKPASIVWTIEDN